MFWQWQLQRHVPPNRYSNPGQDLVDPALYVLLPLRTTECRYTDTYSTAGTVILVTYLRIIWLREEEALGLRRRFSDCSSLEPSWI